MIAVIDQQNYDGIIPKIKMIHGIENPPDLAIGKTGACVIGSLKSNSIGISEIIEKIILRGCVFLQRRTASGLRRKPRSPDRIKIKILRRCDEWVMGLVKTCCDKERLTSMRLHLLNGL